MDGENTKTKEQWAAELVYSTLEKIVMDSIDRTKGSVEIKTKTYSDENRLILDLTNGSRLCIDCGCYEKNQRTRIVLYTNYTSPFFRKQLDVLFDQEKIDAFADQFDLVQKTLERVLA